mgnify:FL=1
MLLIEISGVEGSGKSSLALSAAQYDPPIDYANFDGNLWQAAGRFIAELKSKEIRVEDFGDLGDDEKSKQKIDAEWNHVRTWLDKKLREEKGTIVLDTFDYVADLIKRSLVVGFLQGEELKPNAHAPANAWLDGFIARMKKSKRTVIIMNKVTNPWEIIGQSEAGKNQWGYNRDKWVRALPQHFVDTLRYAIHFSFFTTAIIYQPNAQAIENWKKAADEGKKLMEPKASATFWAEYTESKPNKLLVGKRVSDPTIGKLLDDEKIKQALDVAALLRGEA